MGQGLMQIEGIDVPLIASLIKSTASREEAERLLETVIEVAHSAGVIRGQTEAFRRADAILESVFPSGGKTNACNQV